jgi:hypothetical protein
MQGVSILCVPATGAAGMSPTFLIVIDWFTARNWNVIVRENQRVLVELPSDELGDRLSPPPDVVEVAPALAEPVRPVIAIPRFDLDAFLIARLQAEPADTLARLSPNAADRLPPEKIAQAVEKIGAQVTRDDITKVPPAVLELLPATFWAVVPTDVLVVVPPAVVPVLPPAIRAKVGAAAAGS